MTTESDSRPANAAAGPCSECGLHVAAGEGVQSGGAGDVRVTHRQGVACRTARLEAEAAADARARVQEPSPENAGPGPFRVLLLDAGAWLNAGSAEEAVRAAFERGGLPQWRRSDGNWESVTVRLPVREAEPRGDLLFDSPRGPARMAASRVGEREALSMIGRFCVVSDRLEFQVFFTDYGRGVTESASCAIFALRSPETGEPLFARTAQRDAHRAGVARRDVVLAAMRSPVSAGYRWSASVLAGPREPLFEGCWLAHTASGVPCLVYEFGNASVLTAPVDVVMDAWTALAREREMTATASALWLREYGPESPCVVEARARKTRGERVGIAEDQPCAGWEAHAWVANRSDLLTAEGVFKARAAGV